jgi:glycosyltransferase involved in cell wall biosynthesis
MKVCLLGVYNENLDEGMIKSSFYITNELSKNHQILPLDLRKVTSKSFWKNLKEFNPQIVHYIHGSSFKSFLLLKIISLYCRNVKTIISIMHPHFSTSKHLIYFIKPDLTLVQSNEMENMFKAMKCRTEFLPVGSVDIVRFNPKLKEKKNELRDKYGVDKDKFVLLHVGSIKRGRNVLLLKELQGRNNNQVVIVGPVSTGTHQEVLHQLEEAGCIVWRKYFENIEKIYALSDCYVFPVLPPQRGIMGETVSDSIEMPLSVLEAMSCNLPVISTRFGALHRIFDASDGLFFVDKDDDFIAILESIKYNNIIIKTREKVAPYSWDNIGKKLEEIYLEMMGEPNEK